MLFWFFSGKIVHDMFKQRLYGGSVYVFAQYRKQNGSTQNIK